MSVPSLPALEGRSLLATENAAVDVFFESNQCDHEAQPKTACRPRGQPFDLDSDPGELLDRGSERRDVEAELAPQIDRRMNGLDPLPIRPERDHPILKNRQVLGCLR